MSLQIHITAGVRKGQRLLATTSAVSFGREAGNTLVIDLPEISRKHGELVPQPDGSWLLVNHSVNGTLLNGKKVSNHPLPIHGEMTVAIGKTEILRLNATLALTSATAVTSDASHQTIEPPQAKGKTKLWAGIAVGISTVLILSMVLIDSFSSKPDTDTPSSLNDTTHLLWSQEKVSQTIQSLPPPSATPDIATYEARLLDARALYTHGKPMKSEAWLDAYRAYRGAMRYNDLKFKDPGDAYDYQVIVDEVSHMVWNDYQEAGLAFNRRSYKTASPLFRKIRDYAAGTDPLFGREFRDHILVLKSKSDSRLKK